MTLSSEVRLGVIGLGTIATAVATSLARRGYALLVSQRSRANSERLAADYRKVAVADNQGVVDGSDLIFIGTTGAQAPQVLQAVNFRSDQRVVSFMADLDIEEVARLVAPAQVEALMIPFPCVAQGGAALLCKPGSAILDALFGDDNCIFPIENDQELQAYLSAQAVLSPVVKLLAETQIWLANRLDHAGKSDTVASEAFLRQLIGGSLLAEPLSKPGVLEGLLADLSTPGGFNAELRDCLATAGTYQALTEGLDRLLKRFD